MEDLRIIGDLGLVDFGGPGLRRLLWWRRRREQASQLLNRALRVQFRRVRRRRVVERLLQGIKTGVRQ